MNENWNIWEHSNMWLLTCFCWMTEPHGGFCWDYDRIIRLSSCWRKVLQQQIIIQHDNVLSVFLHTTVLHISVPHCTLMCYHVPAYCTISVAQDLGIGSRACGMTHHHQAFGSAYEWHTYILTHIPVLWLRTNKFSCLASCPVVEIMSHEWMFGR